MPIYSHKLTPKFFLGGGNSSSSNTNKYLSPYGGIMSGNNSISAVAPKSFLVKKLVISINTNSRDQDVVMGMNTEAEGDIMSITTGTTGTFTIEENHIVEAGESFCWLKDQTAGTTGTLTAMFCAEVMEL